jgi:hypothetical protein
MTFTKKKLAAVISGTLLTGMASTALAVVNLDDNSATATAGDTTVAIASEVSIDATDGLDVGDGAGFLDATMVLNPAIIPANSDIRVLVTLSNGTFSVEPVATFSGGAMGIIAGGTGSSSAEFNANVGTSDLAAGDDLDLTFDEINVENTDGVSVTVSVTRADNFGTASVKSLTSALLEHTDSFAVTYTPDAAIDDIDVTAGAVSFEGAATGVTAGEVDIDYTAGVDETGAALLQATISDSYAISIEGANGLDAFSTSTNADATITFGAIALELDGTTASATANTAAAFVTGDVDLDVGATNATVINETSIVAPVTGTPETGFNTDSLNSSGSLSSLNKNGSAARLSFALTPGGAYPQFIRITNPSGISGDVTLQLTNDDGDTSSSVAIASLDAGASSDLLNIDDVFATVQAADATFELGATAKLRVSIDAEFGETGESTGVILGSFSLSTDGNTFNMMTDASN